MFPWAYLDGSRRLRGYYTKFASNVGNIDFYIIYDKFHNKKDIGFYPTRTLDNKEYYKNRPIYLCGLNYLYFEDFIKLVDVGDKLRYYYNPFMELSKFIDKHELKQFKRGNKMIYRSPKEWEFYMSFKIMLPLLSMVALHYFVLTYFMYIFLFFIAYLTCGCFLLSWYSKNKISAFIAELEICQTPKSVLFFLWPIVILWAVMKFIIFSDISKKIYKKIHGFISGQVDEVSKFMFGGTS